MRRVNEEGRLGYRTPEKPVNKRKYMSIKDTLKEFIETLKETAVALNEAQGYGRCKQCGWDFDVLAKDIEDIYKQGRDDAFKKTVATDLEYMSKLEVYLQGKEDGVRGVIKAYVLHFYGIEIDTDAEWFDERHEQYLNVPEKAIKLWWRERMKDL